jgi:hypothetical protein
MRRKLILLIASVIILIQVACSIQSKPLAGNWKGENISFTLNETSDTIIELNIVIPYEGEYLAQMYQALNIKEGKFSSYRDGNSYLGIPEANLEGEFLSDRLAKGTFNGIGWTATPVSAKE